MRVVLALVALMAGVGALAERGASPRFAAAAQPSRDGELGPGLHVAGSGACLPLARDLAAGFVGADVTIHESVGSTGGVRAVADGAIEVGLVSRPLHAREEALGLEVVPFARVPVVLVAHPDVAVRSVSRSEVIDLVRAPVPRWRDGRRSVVWLRERGDSAQAAIARALPGFGDALDASLDSARSRVVFHDEELIRAVARTPGGVGVSDLVQASRAPLPVLAIDGIEPSAASVASGRYPFHRDLAIVLGPSASRDARAFAAFVVSEEGRAIVRAAGALPLGGEGAP